MTKYELLSILIACVAAIASLVVWSGQRRLQREANDLQRATSKLAEKQLELLLREEKGKNAARLSLTLTREGKTHRLRIANVSDVDALNVNLRLILPKPEDSPLIESECREKLPAKRLSSGTSVSLIAVLHLGSPTAYNGILSWNNLDGSYSEQETYVAL